MIRRLRNALKTVKETDAMYIRENLKAGLNPQFLKQADGKEELSFGLDETNEKVINFRFANEMDFTKKWLIEKIREGIETVDPRCYRSNYHY